MHPILLRAGRFSVASYGVLAAAGYLAGILWLKPRLIARLGCTESRFWGLIYCVFFGAVAGGKLLFVALNWGLYASGDMGLLRDFRYGFVFFGGFLGASLSALAYARLAGLDFLRCADYFGVAVPLGHAIGRLGCLAAGCCYGRPTQLPWGLRFTAPGCLVEDALRGVPLHPTQLYESLGNAALAALVYYGPLRRVESGKSEPGVAFACYALLYAALRFVVEVFRGDDRGGFWLGLSPSQWLALACAAAAASWLERRRAWKKRA